MTKETVGRPMEILLVEDSLTHARLAIGMLDRAHFRHRVTLIRDGVEAMEFLYREGRFARAPRPDLILLDLGLPKMDGREVLSRVKEDYDLKDIPVVVVTGSGAEEDRIRSELLHVESYMTKPVHVRQFLEVINELRHHWHSDVMLPL